MAKITAHGERDVARWRKIGEPSEYHGSRSNQTPVRWLLGGFALSILLWVLIGVAVWQFVVWV